MNLKTYMAACAALLCAVATVSCEDVFETGTTSVVFEQDNQLQSPNDSLYSVMGILSQAQKLGEKYVLFGELRGDLMTTTADADEDMQDLAAFRQSEHSSFRSYSDFYSVINNCNYAIAHMNVDYAPYGEKLMLPEYVQIKVIRAWTYLQLALARGEVYWLERPVMNFEESMADYPVKNIEQVADALIADLEPYIDVRPPLDDDQTVDFFKSTNMFIPTRLMLGDLYLLRGRYEEAVRAYAGYIRKIGESGKYSSALLNVSYSNNWVTSSFNGCAVAAFSSYSNEAVTSFFYSANPNSYHPRLVRWTFNNVPFFLPTESFMDEMANKPHVFTTNYTDAATQHTITVGDLRGQALTPVGKKIVGYSAYGEMELVNTKAPYILKFYRNGTVTSGNDPENEALDGSLAYTNQLAIYRAPHVWLRFAEALNRMGKPSLAYTVLKCGLRKNVLEDPTLVSPEDVAFLNSLGVDFTLDAFNNNYGSFARGLGRGVPKDRTVYVIPDYTRYVSIEVTDDDGDQVTVSMPSENLADIEAARADSILFVEDNIVNELAAETCFEGNRFFDLYRVASHRNEFPAYMAKKVAARFGNEASSMEAKLNDRNVWFVK